VKHLCKHREEVAVHFQHIHNRAVEGGGWAAPRTGLFGPGKDPYTFYRKMGGLLSQPPEFMCCRQSSSMGAVLRSLFVDCEIIKETNYIEA
jgi:hypothetical protein